MILCNFWRLLFMKILDNQLFLKCSNRCYQQADHSSRLFLFSFTSTFLSFPFSSDVNINFMHHYLSHDSKSNNNFWYMMIYGIYSLFDSHWWCWDHPWVGRYPDSLPLKSKSQIFQQFWVLKMMCADMARKMHFSIWVFQWVRQLVDICFILNWIDHNWACHC